MIDPGKLSAAEHTAILEWCQLIGETDQIKIKYTLERCTANKLVLEWVLGENLLAKLKAKGAIVSLDGDKLTWQVPGGRPDQATREWFVAHEHQIIAALKKRGIRSA